MDVSPGANNLERKDDERVAEDSQQPRTAFLGSLDGRATAHKEHKCIQNKHTPVPTGDPSKMTNPRTGEQSSCCNNSVSRLDQLVNGVQARIDDNSMQAEEKYHRMCSAVRTLIECIGENPDREGLQATPSRYAKALLFFTKGYHVDMEEIVNRALFQEDHDEMVVVKDIEIQSLCEHHLVPFIGKMHIGYIPCGTVIGLSKLPRIAEMFSRRLQIQERLTKEVAGTIMEVLNPQGVVVVMESSHLCMVMRGVEKTGTSTITSCVLGCFKEDARMRREFLSLVGI